MSRVDEDREAQRIEQVRIDRDLADKKIAGKHLEDNKQFTKIMNSRQEGSTQQERRDTSSQQQNNNAAQALMARQGFASQNFGRGLATGGDARLTAKRAGNEAMSAERGISRDMGKRKNAEMEDKDMSAKGGSVGSKGGRGGEGHKGGNTGALKDKRDAGDQAAQQRLLNVFGPMGGALTAADGIGAKASQGSGGTSGPSPHEIVDQIVKHVRTGVTALTQSPMIQIDLKDDVLAGSRLTITRGKNGVELNIQTIDPDGNVARLLGNGDTVKDLTQALSNHGIVLEKLHVDDRKVYEALR